MRLRRAELLKVERRGRAGLGRRGRPERGRDLPTQTRCIALSLTVSDGMASWEIRHREQRATEAQTKHKMTHYHSRTKDILEDLMYRMRFYSH